jgi:fructose-1,6-bisphosphatase-3
VDAAGRPLTLRVDGRDLAGRELMDALAATVRRAYRADRRRHERGREVGEVGANPDADWLYYLWGGPRSPLFGKDKLATFETHFIADKQAHKEHKNPYFEFMHDAEFVRDIGRLFACGDDVLIVNGHVPVKVEKGEQPVKRGGNAVTIDGAFSEAYGDRGYTLVLKPDHIELAEHSKFTSIDDVIDAGADIVPTVQTIRTYPAPRRTRDTMRGREIQQRIDDLLALVRAYQEGEIGEGMGR